MKRFYTALLTLCLTGFPAAAQSLETLVLTVGGHATCGSFTTPQQVSAFFGSVGPSLPVGGLGPCNVAGDLRSATATVGPLSDAMNLAVSWGSPPNSVVDFATALADYGTLAAQADCTLTYGSGSGSTAVIGAEGFGIMTEGLTITSPSVPNGQAGWMRVQTTVSGALSTTGNGTSEVTLAYRINSGASFTTFRSQAFGLGLPLVLSGTGSNLSGFSVGPGAMSGSGVIQTFFIPIVFNTPLTFKLGLLTHTVPGLTNLELHSNFQAAITGFEIYGPSGPALSSFSIAASSGALYGPDGVQPKPFIYCTAKLSSAGCASAISTSSATVPTSGANDYSVTCSNVQGAKNGLLFAGIQGPATVAFNAGTLCVRPPLKRGPIVFSGNSNPNACAGAFTTLVNDGNVVPTGLDAGSGNSGWYQYWYRDPQNGAGNLGTALSNAVRLDFQ